MFSETGTCILQSSQKAHLKTKRKVFDELLAYDGLSILSINTFKEIDSSTNHRDTKRLALF